MRSSGWHSHSTSTRLWALCSATGFTSLVLLLFMADHRHWIDDALPAPIVLSVRLLPDWMVQTHPSALSSHLASRPATTSPRRTQAHAVTIEDRDIKTPKTPKTPHTALQVAPITQTQPLPVDTGAPSASTTKPSAEAPLDLSTQTRGRALESVRPGGSLSESAQQRHGLAAPHERERWTNAVSRSAKPDCLAGDQHGSLLDLPVRLLQALRDQCK